MNTMTIESHFSKNQTQSVLGKRFLAMTASLTRAGELVSLGQGLDLLWTKLTCVYNICTVCFWMYKGNQPL